MTEQIDPNPVDRFLEEINAGAGISADVFVADAHLDATVPDWRFEKRGAAAVAAQFSHWYTGPVAIERSNRVPVPGGEVVELELSGADAGVPYAAHQVHLVTVADGRISAHTVFCGGRWSADRLAEMEEARAQ